jgi:hypothetical protein
MRQKEALGNEFMFEDVPKGPSLWDLDREHDLSPSTRFLILIACALASWGIVLAVGWGVFRLLRALI